MPATPSVTARRSKGGRLRLAIVLAAAAAMVLPGMQAVAVNEPLEGLVRQLPADHTPHVMNGIVEDIAVAADVVVVGGSFTQIAPETSDEPTVSQPANHSEDVIDRPYLFAFDRDTGAIVDAFQPNVGGPVAELALAPDGNSVYVGGSFGTGANASLLRISLADGSVVPTFDPYTEGQVFDLALRDGVVYAGVDALDARGWEETTEALIAVDAETGDRIESSAPVFSGSYEGGAFEPTFEFPVGVEDSTVPVRVVGLDVSPDGTQLIAVGNFSTIDGEDRVAAAMFNIAADGTPELALGWQTNRFPHGACLLNLDVYMRGVEIDPSGDYAVIYTTGFQSEEDLCDTLTRWEMDATGTDLQPSWVTYSGGDTYTEVAITGDTIYTGGHFNWLNAYYANFNDCVEPGVQTDDCPSPGGADRQGLAAIDPRNGVPFSWDPGRPRGEGVYAITSVNDGTNQGVYMGSDTARWNTNDRDTAYMEPDDFPFNAQYQNRLALFPTSDGLPDVDYLEVPALPSQLHQAPSAGEDVTIRAFDGQDLGAPTIDQLGMDWTGVHGAFAVEGRVYYGAPDGTFRVRSFDGNGVGGDQEVRPLPLKPDYMPLTTERQLDSPGGGWGAPDIILTPFPVDQVTGMAYDHVSGQLYYTLEGDPKLYHRAFTEESNIVGDRCVAQAPVDGSGMDVDWSDARGLHIDVGTGQIFWGDTSGNLNAAAFDNGNVTNRQTIATADGWGQGPLFTYGAAADVGDPNGADIAPAPVTAEPDVTGPGVCHEYEEVEEEPEPEPEPTDDPTDEPTDGPTDGPTEPGTDLDGVSPVVLGGTLAVSEELESELDGLTGGDAPARWHGKDRYATAVRVSQESFDPGVPVAYVANAHSFPDALAGGAAAGLVGGPVLLVGKDEIPEVVADELARLEPERIVVLGGTVAVSDAVKQALDPLTDGAVQRLGGADRYATAALLSRATFQPGVSEVWIATGENFPDALAAGPAAVVGQAPILLVPQSGVPDAVVAELQRLQPDRIMVAGGEVAVSADVEAALAAHATDGVARVKGANRYATAAAISALAFGDGATHVFASTGLNFPDALAGGAAAGRLGSPILLVDGPTVPEASRDEIVRLDELAASTSP